ncbi:MAG TPA: Na/Pi symporter [Bacillota bacterium]|nr:Na/Pi symporter [Bacillota bacterium]HOL10929.1 Na/Pi symporter [Bacillota bacterium]HPO98652.1 Na/Pi symporter [Bacillota bacterium]
MSAVIEGLLIILGALGLFLQAIGRFGDGVQKRVGEKIRIIIEKQSRKPLPSVLNGIAMAAALQSNYLTFGTVSSLVNAGLLGLLPALCIMLGVNLGLTVTAQLMSLNIGVFLFVLLFCGYLLNFYGKKRGWHYLGQILFNLGLMYLSFYIFHYAFQTLGMQSLAVDALRGIILNPWLCFFVGLGLAAIFRSSNTVVVLTQSMVGLQVALNPVTFLSGAFAIVIGANIGTTFINMLVGMDRQPIVKKANWMHFSFNLITGLIWLTFLPVAFYMVSNFSVQLYQIFQKFFAVVFNIKIPNVIPTERWFNIWEIAMANTIYNLSVIFIWFPITLLASKLGVAFFSEKSKIGTNGTTYLDRRALQTPALALMLASHEIKQMANITREMLKSARLAFSKGQIHLLDGIGRDEEIVDEMQEQITFYLSALLSQNSLTEEQSHRLAGLLHIVSDIERVGDHAYNVANLAEKKYLEKLQFSELAINEIELMFGKAMDFYNKACMAFYEDKSELSKQLLNREENIDKLEEELRQNHIHRLNQGKCWPSSGVVYVEMLSNLQRIAAHAANIASAILEEGEA